MANINIHNQTLTAGSDDDDSFILLPGSSQDGTANTMMGGLGNDYYEVDAPDSVVLENAKSGIDTIRIMGNITSQTFTLYNNVENVLLSNNVFRQNILGNAENNVMAVESSNLTLHAYLDGGAGNDTLHGDAGENFLVGGVGADVMRGYNGNDQYFVDNAGDKVIEDSASGGRDSVFSSITYTLGKNLENLTLQGTANINAIGNELNNYLWGTTGNNTLIGGGGDDYIGNGQGGNDWIDGGSGNDSLVAYEGNNTIFGGSGHDTLRGGYGNDFLDGGSGDDSIQAGQGTNLVYGGQGNDILEGYSGSDLMDGGDGNDILTDWGNSPSGTPTGNILRGGNGNDLIIAQMNGYRGWGNTLEGGNGNDVLVDNAESYYNTDSQGINKADVLNGGAGNDQYYLRISSGLDKIQIIDTSGYDTVHLGRMEITQNITPAYSNFTLGASTLDHLQFTLATGIENVDASQANIVSYLVGNSGHNKMLGSATTDVIIAGAGNDTLDGGGGADNLLGGSGDDTYIINDSNDSVVEEASSGIDKVISNISYRLASNVENLSLLGTANIDGIGNALDNTIEGNQGINLINGGDGNDILSGGNDTERDVLWGGSGNDVLYGGITDILYGGSGNDSYYIQAGAYAYENSDEGIDSVISYGAFQLGANLENLTLATGPGNWDAIGNDLDNYLKGNGGMNTLVDSYGSGTNDQDTMEGGKGNDTYTSHWSQDGTKRDKIIELDGGGDDIVNLIVDGLTKTMNLTLGAGEFNNIEKLHLGNSNVNAYVGDLAFKVLGSSADNRISGSLKNDWIDGGAGNDWLSGYYGNDTLIGGSGNDYLEGGIGSDWLDGGTGNDMYFIDNGDIIKESTLASGGIDNIYASNISVDLKSVYKGVENAYSEAIESHVTLTGTDGIANTLGGKQAGTYVLEMIGGTGNDTYEIKSANDLSKVRIIEGGAGTTGDFDTVISHISNYTLADNVEKLVLAGTVANGYGNSLNNTLIGNHSSNTLDGGAGNDRMEGMGGNDIYIVNSTGDMIIEETNGGYDEIYIFTNGTYSLAANVEYASIEDDTLGSAHLIGNDQDNDLSGNVMDNTIVAGGGNDILFGAAGNDRLDGGSGNDEVDGEKGDDSLYGGAGNDLMIGGAGNDLMEGGTGNDIYYVDSVSDIVSEKFNEGIDTVTLIGYINPAYTLETNIENLYAYHAGKTDTLIGNDLANTITGSAQANFIDGGKGADVLLGGTGNDTYWVDTTADLIRDDGGDSADLVIAKNISFNLASNGIGVEGLTLENGTFNVTGIGNTLGNTITVTGTGNSTLDGGGGNDTLTGNIGLDTLIGGAGNDILNGSGNVDTLTGGQGLDIFHFNKYGSADADFITDYSVGDDHIRLDTSAFTGLLDTDANKILDAGDFLANYSGGGWSNAHIAYNATSGELWYSAQGNGMDKMLIATLDTGAHPILSNADILLM